MKKIDSILPKLNFVAALIITIVISIALELTGVWMLMFVAGAIGAMFVRNTKKAFGVGFFGVGLGWTVLFVYLAAIGQALAVGNYFIGLLGLESLGILVIIISVLIGSLLGGFGGVLGRSLIEVIDEFISKDNPPMSIDEG
jgi:hypothetical protein